MVVGCVWWSSGVQPFGSLVMRTNNNNNNTNNNNLNNKTLRMMMMAASASASTSTSKQRRRRSPKRLKYDNTTTKPNKEAVAVTTAIQEEILLEFGIDPRVGLACLGKVNTIFENDQELMIQFYRFVMKEEMACEEAELGPDLFAEKMEMQHNLQQSQLEMLEHMRKFHLDDQSAILEKLHQQLEEANFDSEASVLTVEQVQDIVRRRVTPVYSPK